VEIDYFDFVRQLMEAVFERLEPKLGEVELICAGPNGAAERVHAYYETLASKQKKGALVGANPLIVFGLAEPINQDEYDQAVGARNAGDAEDPEKIKNLFDSSLARKLHVSSMCVEDYVEALNDIPENGILVLLDVGYLRNKDEAKHAHAELPGIVQFTGDQWVPAVVDFVSAIIPIAQRRNLYIVLDTGFFLPHREELMHILDESGARTSYLSPPEGSEETIAGVAAQWTEWDAAGLVGKILRSIKDLPNLSDAERIQAVVAVYIKGISKN